MVFALFAQACGQSGPLFLPGETNESGGPAPVEQAPADTTPGGGDERDDDDTGGDS